MGNLFLKTGRGRKIFVMALTAGLMLEGDLFHPSAKGLFLCLAEENAAGPAITAPAPLEKNLISLDFQNVSLKEILRVLSQEAGINFVASELIQDKKVTVLLDNVTIGDALNTIMEANALFFEQKPGTNIYVVKEKEASAPQVMLETKIYKLNYASVSGADVSAGGGIEAVIQQFLTPNGKLVIDARTNSLLITDTPINLEKIEGILKELDVKSIQVMISAEILEVAVDTLKRLGIEWGNDSGQFASYAGGSRSTFWPFRESLFKGVTEASAVGSISFTSFTAVLKAIKTDASTEYLARPRLLTLNNKTAEIKITKNAAVSSSTVTTAGGGLTQAVASLERYEVGTVLKVTPHVNKDDYITMTVEPEVSRVKESSWSSSYFDPFTRSAKTTIMVKDGETIVIAGLISRENSDSDRKMPILGEIPLVGKIFSRNTKQRSDTEVLIFITPYIIKEEGAALATALREELGLPYVAQAPREGGILPQSPAEFINPAAGQKGYLSKYNRFRRLVREQDMPFSNKETAIDMQMIELGAPPVKKF